MVVKKEKQMYNKQTKKKQWKKKMKNGNISTYHEAPSEEWYEGDLEFYAR